MSTWLSCNIGALVAFCDKALLQLQLTQVCSTKYSLLSLLVYITVSLNIYLIYIVLDVLVYVYNGLPNEAK